MIFELNSSSRWDENDPLKPTNPKYWIDRNLEL